LNRIGRYIFRQALGSTIVVIGVLLIILMSNQFAETLGDAAANLLPREAVLKVFGFQFVQMLSLLAPVGLLLGVLLALARLNRDSEMAALASCGIGPMQLLRPIGLLSVGLALAVSWLALIGAPAASLEVERIRFQAQTEMELGALTAGRFSTLDGGTMVVYAASSRGDILEDVFIEWEIDGRIEVVVAREGERVMNPETGESLLRLRDGRRYVGVPGEARFSLGLFQEHGIPIRFEETVFEQAIEARSTASLLRMGDAESRAELEWRIASPLSILILALLAVPLGQSSPREGKYARVGAGLLIYIVYANSLSIARVWVERETIPSWLGLWWVHALVGGLAIFMLLRQSGVGVSEQSVQRERLAPTN
jgi:lipopolysaccharide export system permease protein